jgi:hypothetical protein
MRSSFIRCLSVLLLCVSPLIAATRHEPPMPPLPMSVSAVRGVIQHAARSHQLAANAFGPPNPSKDTIILPLSAGLSMISVPVYTDSDVLSDIFPGLPEGSRVWTWDAPTQQLVEGFDRHLALGQGAFLYLPQPAVVVVTGQFDKSSEIPVELSEGWNLVGVPYDGSLPRAAQVVYENSLQMAFNDAVEQGAIVEPISTLDPSGYREIGPDDTFDSMHAYWVYSDGPDLIEMQSGIVQSGGLLGIDYKAIAWWGAEQAGSYAGNYAAGQLFNLIFPQPNPNQDVLDKLDAVSKQISALDDKMTAIDNKIEQTQQQIKLVQLALEGAIKEVNLDQVRAELDAHYDDPSLMNQSYMWFQANAKKGIPDSVKQDFAKYIMTGANYPTMFSLVKNTIIPTSTSPGILENYAAQIVVGNVQGTTLEDRYKAMEAYFNSLLTLQVKLMTMITSAMNLQDPMGVAGDNWRKTTYTNAIRDEALRFRAVTEGIIVSRLRISAGPNDAPVTVPPEISATIAPSLDFGMMRLLGEAPGVRVRVYFGRYLNENDPVVISDQNGNTILGLPSFDSGLWATVPAGQYFDSWRIRPADSALTFYRDDSWYVYKAVLPTSLPQGNYQLRLRDAWNFTDDNQTPALYGLQAVRVGNVDANNQPSSAGTLFGSITLAKRTAARTALRIMNDGKSSKYDLCKPANAAKFGKENDYFIVSGNCYGGGWAGFQRIVPFYFAGPGASATGGWQEGLTTRMAKCNVDFNTCYNYYSLGQIQLLDNDVPAIDIIRFDSATQQSYEFPVTFQTSRTYLHMRNVHSSAENGATTEIWRGPIVFTFK